MSFQNNSNTSRPKSFDLVPIGDPRVQEALARKDRILLRLGDGSHRAVAKVGKPSTNARCVVETVPDLSDGHGAKARQFTILSSVKVQIFRAKPPAIEEITETGPHNQDQEMPADEAEEAFVPAQVVGHRQLG